MRIEGENLLNTSLVHIHPDLMDMSNEYKTTMWNKNKSALYFHKPITLCYEYVELNIVVEVPRHLR